MATVGNHCLHPELQALRALVLKRISRALVRVCRWLMRSGRGSSRCSRTGRRSRGGRWRDHREVIDAIAFKSQTGTQWVHLPEKTATIYLAGLHIAGIFLWSAR